MSNQAVSNETGSHQTGPHQTDEQVIQTIHNTSRFLSKIVRSPGPRLSPLWPGVSTGTFRCRSAKTRTFRFARR
jgi:hypothetical protein